MKIKKLVFSILIILVCLSTTSCSKKVEKVEKVENCRLIVGFVCGQDHQDRKYYFTLHNEPKARNVYYLNGTRKQYYCVEYATIDKTKIVVYSTYGSLNEDIFREDYTETFTITNYSYYTIKPEGIQ